MSRRIGGSADRRRRSDGQTDRRSDSPTRLGDAIKAYTASAGLARRIERTDAQIVDAWRAAGPDAPSRGGLLALLGVTS